MFLRHRWLLLLRAWVETIFKEKCISPPSELRVNYLQERVLNKIVLRSNFKLSIKAFDFIFDTEWKLHACTMIYAPTEIYIATICQPPQANEWTETKNKHTKFPIGFFRLLVEACL